MYSYILFLSFSLIHSLLDRNNMDNNLISTMEILSLNKKESLSNKILNNSEKNKFFFTIYCLIISIKEFKFSTYI